VKIALDNVNGTLYTDVAGGKPAERTGMMGRIKDWFLYWDERSIGEYDEWEAESALRRLPLRTRLRLLDEAIRDSAEAGDIEATYARVYAERWGQVEAKGGRA